MVGCLGAKPMVPRMTEGWLHFCRDSEEGQQDAGAMPDAPPSWGECGPGTCHWMELLGHRDALAVSFFFYSLQVKIIICNMFQCFSLYFFLFFRISDLLFLI